MDIKINVLSGTEFNHGHKKLSEGMGYGDAHYNDMA
jgi:hypothetical protein